MRILGIAGCALVSLASAGGAVAIASGWVTSTDGVRPGPAPAAPLAPAPLPPVAPPPAPPPPVAPPPAPPPVAPPVIATVTPVPIPCAHVVEIRFSYDDARPPKSAADDLAAIVAFARSHPLAEIIVAGHADPTGAEIPNLFLSKQRAAGIASLLVAAGTPRNRISERAYGSYAPRAGALAEQRRVTVDIREPDCRDKERP